MARVVLSGYRAERSGVFLSIMFEFGKPPAFPPRIVEVKNAKDCAAAFEAYRADAEASGLPLAVSMSMMKGDRKPPGFNKLKAGPIGVNLKEKEVA